MTRRRPDDSSLELLLDTICNTFGGILFLAMLVSLLLQTTRHRTVATRDDQRAQRPALVKSEIVRLSSRARDLAEELRRVEADLSHVREFIARFMTPELDRAVDELHAAQREQLSLEAQRVQILADTAANDTAAVTAANSAVAARRGLHEAEECARAAALRYNEAEKRCDALAASAASLRRHAESRSIVQTSGKAPRERRTSKTEFGVLVRYGRVYFTHIHNGAERAVNTDDFTVVAGVNGNTARAKPGGGIDISSTDAPAALWRQLERYPAKTWYPCIVVHPDSFDVFQILKSKLVADGYEYRVVATNAPVIDHGGQGRVQ